MSSSYGRPEALGLPRRQAGYPEFQAAARRLDRARHRARWLDTPGGGGADDRLDTAIAREHERAESAFLDLLGGRAGAIVGGRLYLDAERAGAGIDAWRVLIVPLRAIEGMQIG